VRRQPPSVPGWLPGFHGQAVALLTARDWRITVVMAAGTLALWLVLLACLVWRHAPALIHASPHHTEANPEMVSRN
jgi:hypothetical protein